MPIPGGRLWPFIGLGAAGLFAAGALVAVNVTIGERQDAESRSPSTSASALQQRYSAAQSAIDAWASTKLDSRCETDQRIADAVEIEDRMSAALEGAAIVREAWIILNPDDREAFEAARSERIAQFDAGFATDDDRGLTAQYEGVEDIVAACLAQLAEPAPSPSRELTVEDVEVIEARAAALDDTSAADTSHLDALYEAISSFRAPLLATADARVPVRTLGETEQALHDAAAQLRSEPSPERAAALLEALVMDAQAALGWQAAQQRQEELAEQQQQQPPVQQAPAPQPEPDPEPEPTGEPVPTTPGASGDTAPDAP